MQHRCKYKHQGLHLGKDTHQALWGANLASQPLALYLQELEEGYQ